MFSILEKEFVVKDIKEAIKMASVFEKKIK